MWTTEDQTVAAGHSVTPARWQAGLEELLGRVAAVYLAYATTAGHGVIDRELYLPQGGQLTPSAATPPGYRRQAAQQS
jgi:hypothetical protein